MLVPSGKTEVIFVGYDHSLLKYGDIGYIDGYVYMHSQNKGITVAIFVTEKGMFCGVQIDEIEVIGNES